MKKIINAPENYVNDMLKGIYAAHSDQVKYAADDLRCYCRAEKKPGKVAIITGGGSGHLPLFLGYVGDGMIDGCGVGGVFQSPSPEQIYNITKEVEAGAGVLYLYGNYLFFSISAIFIARTFNGRPNKVMNPSASWWSYKSPVVKLAKDSL